MANINPQQILLPKQVYLGDTAELRCSFNSGELLFKQMTANGTTEISTEAFTAILDGKDYEILNVQLAPAGIDYYQLSITFKPWKTGKIHFPELKLGENQILFQPVEIVSLTQTTKVTGLKESQSPLLLPGTAYKLYGSLILLVIMIIAGIQLIIKRERVAAAIYRRRQKRKFRKNQKQTLKSLNKLDCENHKDWAEKVQKIMRNYMEIRFDFPFTKTVTSEMMDGFYTATNRVYSEDKQRALEEITAAFVRTDYIRYKENAVFNDDERSEILKMLNTNIAIIEGESDNA